MRSDREIRRVLRQNLARHGKAVELLKLVEECGELTQAAAKLMTCGRITEDMVEHLAEEMADLEICMEQARMIFPGLRDMEETWIERKVARLEVRLAEWEDDGRG